MQTNIEAQYLALLDEVLTKGAFKPLQAGEGEATGVYSIFGAQLKADFADGFPIYKTKTVYWKAAIGEMLWFLEGSGDIRKLQAMNIHIWDEWEAKHGSPVLPLHYTGMTNWGPSHIDQTAWVLDAITEKPFRKSYLVSSWDPAQVYAMAEANCNEPVVLPACHYAHQLNVRQGSDSLTYMVSLNVNIRSNDLFLGNPFNVVQYAALLKMYCLCLYNRTSAFWLPDKLVVQIGDAHIYDNHREQCMELIGRGESLAQAQHCLSATLAIFDRGQTKLTDFVLDDFRLFDYEPMGKISAPLYVAGGK